MKNEYAGIGLKPTLSKERRGELVDSLLIELNDQVDAEGAPISVVPFSFSEEDTDIFESLDVNFKELTILLDLCLSRKYLKHSVMGAGKYGRLILTEEGQGRGLSADAARRNPTPSVSSEGNINIGTLNTSGATQVGHYNTQNIEQFTASLVERIDQADASEEDKQEAKSRLKSFLSHPLMVAILGPTVAAALAMLGGE